MTRTSRFKLPLLSACGLVALYVFFDLVSHLGVAHAAAIDDPIAMATVSTDSVYTVIATYGWLWGGMAVVFGSLSWLLSRNESTHWIAQGRTLAVLTASAGLGVAALKAHFGGAPWSGVMLTLIVGIFKVISPVTIAKQTDQQATRSSKTMADVNAGIVILALLTFGTAAMIASCGAAQRAGHDVIDCTGGSAPGVAVNIFDTMRAWAAPKEQGGCADATTFDWNCIESKAFSKGIVTGGCALAEFVQSYLAPAYGRAAPGIEGGVDQAARARSTLEHFRATAAGGATFHTGAGDL